MGLDVLSGKGSLLSSLLHKHAGRLCLLLMTGEERKGSSGTCDKGEIAASECICIGCWAKKHRTAFSPLRNALCQPRAKGSDKFICKMEGNIDLNTGFAYFIIIIIPGGFMVLCALNCLAFSLQVTIITNNSNDK